MGNMHKLRKGIRLAQIYSDEILNLVDKQRNDTDSIKSTVLKNALLPSWENRKERNCIRWKKRHLKLNHSHLSQQQARLNVNNTKNLFEPFDNRFHSFEQVTTWKMLCALRLLLCQTRTVMAAYHQVFVSLFVYFCTLMMYVKGIEDNERKTSSVSLVTVNVFAMFFVSFHLTCVHGKRAW